MDKSDENEWEYQTTPFSDTCMFCIHLNEDISKRTCKAFPTVIPKEIWMGENDHTKPYPGDHGIRFKERTTQTQKATLVMEGTDSRPDSDYDPAELTLGIKTEMEHTDNPAIASKIAKDQLDEDPKYYSKMKKKGML